MHGTVVKNTGSWYIVRTDDGRAVECKLKGNFRLKGIRSTSPIAVGDTVEIVENAEGTAFIVALDDRRNYIIRKSPNLSKQSHILAANIDQVFLLVTPSSPETSPTFIDRFLASAEAYRIPVVLLFNKTDRYTPADRETVDYWETVYTALDYQCLRMSLLDKAGADTVRPLLKDRVTLLAGNSGVGKSTLLNALVPGLCVRTGEVSEAHGTGVHTTTFSELFELPGGGSIIDIPGIKGFGTFDMEREEVAHYFREIFRCSDGCRFDNCTHTHEPGCAVLEAVENHRIAPSRYASYLSMLDDKNENKYRQAY